MRIELHWIIVPF